jgi:hypothetical protein
MKISRFIVMVAAGVALPLTCAAVELNTGGKTEAELNAEMVVRCQYQMGEFGNVAIGIGVESEREARKLLATYPEEVASIVRRCNRVMEKAGWSMIKTCSDKDIAARDALAQYPAQHAETIEACRAREGRYGHAKVKRCVDDQLAGGGGSDGE